MAHSQEQIVRWDALWESRKGLVFHFLTVLGRAGRGRALCRCTCGVVKPVTWIMLERNLIKSCGCKTTELKALGHIKHGLTQTYTYRLWWAAKRRAQILKLPFDLVLEDVHVPLCCPVLGILLRQSLRRGRRTDDSPSIDRRDNSRGYTKDNIQIISWRANSLKSNMTAKEARLLAQYMED